MKRLFISLAAIIVMLITLVSCGGKKTEDSPATTTNQPTLVDSARSIKVVELDGTATVTDESETINCFKGMNLYDGDIVNVLADSVLVIKFDSDKYVYLGENTKINIKSSGTDKYKTNVYIEKGTVLAEIQNKLGEDEEFFLSSNNSVMAVRGTVFGVSVKEVGNDIIETYSVFKGVTELYVFDKSGEAIIKGKLSDLSNTKIEIVVPKSHILNNDEFSQLLNDWLRDINNKFDDPTDANENLDLVNITVSTPTKEDYELIVDKLHGETINYSQLSYYSEGYFGPYDGMTHKINVIPNDKNAKVYYKGEGEATYKEENDYEFIAPGSYRVYYKIVLEGQEDKEDFEVIHITKPNIDITGNFFTYDNFSKMSYLDITSLENDAFNRYNGIKANLILEDLKFYINGKEINAKSNSINYNHIIDNYIELENGRNTLMVTFVFDDYSFETEVYFGFKDTRYDLGYEVGVVDSNLESLGGNLYYMNTSLFANSTDNKYSIDGQSLLNTLGVDINELDSIYINYPKDMIDVDAQNYNALNQVTLESDKFNEISLLIFPTANTKGYSENINIYLGQSAPNIYPEYQIKNTNYAYDPSKASSVKMDFISSQDVVLYSLDNNTFNKDLNISEEGTYKVYYKVYKENNNEVFVTGFENVVVSKGKSTIAFDNSKFITNPVFIFSNDNRELSYDIDSKEFMVNHYNVSSDDGRTITSLNDAYLVYSSLIKNAKFYDSITKEEIEATVVVSEKKDSSANFNYTISAQGYDTISGTVVFDYSTIGILTNDNGFDDESFNVTLPSDFTVKLSDVPTIVASRTYVASEESSLSYQSYYSIDEGKTWTTVSPKITEAGEYDVYTLYCFTEKGNCATSLIEDALLNQISLTTLSASGNFIIAIQHITVVE